MKFCYWLCYWGMLIGYLGVSVQSVDLKTKIVGILLMIVNGLIFYKG